MKVLHQTVVTPDQIDHLGHMNVRFYGVAARHGARALLGALGAEPAAHRAGRSRPLRSSSP